MYLSSTAAVATSALVFTHSELHSTVLLPAYEDCFTILEGDGNSQLQRWSSFIGITTAIVGNILISFALNIQRYAHIRLNRERQERREQLKRSSRSTKNGNGVIRENGNGEVRSPPREDVAEDQEEETDPLTRSFHSSDSQSTIVPGDDDVQETSYLKSPYWWAGIVLMTIGETGNFLAYGFAPASIVSPLGVVALISNCVIAPIMLKERFRWRDFWGVVVAVGGAVTVVLSAKHQEKKLGPSQVIHAITTTEFEIYMGVTLVLIGLLMWASPKYGNRTILIDLGLVGLFGGYTALATKGIASMLSSTFWKAFTTPITYVLIAVLIVTAIMQVKYVNKALQRFDSTQVIPVQFVMFTLSVIIGSAVLYRDFEKTDAARAVKFIGGCLLTFFGVFLITSGRTNHMDDDDDEDLDEESGERAGGGAQDTTAEEGFYHDEQYKYGQARPVRHSFQETGDGVDDTDDMSIDQSRRSSRSSFLSTPTRPGFPRMQSNTPESPSFRLSASTGRSHNSQFDETSPLLTNPWKSSQDDLLLAQKRRGMPLTTSTPVLPTEAQMPIHPVDLARPSTPRTSSQENPHTRPHDQNPDGPPPADHLLHHHTPLARHSISRMLPGPFLSPLSSSLAAVVADSLRKGVDPPVRRHSTRRPRLSVRPYRSGSEQHGSETATEEALGTSPAKNGLGISQSLGSRSGEELLKRSRARSLSNALGDFLRGKRARREDDEGEREDGPSGQS